MGEIRAGFQAEVTAKGVPESGISWVRLSGAQSIQYINRVFDTPSPLLSTSPPPLIPMATLRDNRQHFKGKETSWEKSSKTHSAGQGQSQDQHLGQVHL